MLPCNVIVQQISNSQVEIAAINPIASKQAVDNSSLSEVDTDIIRKLEQVINIL